MNKTKKSLTNQKYYVPIVLSDQFYTTRTDKEGFIEEMYFFPNYHRISIKSPDQSKSLRKIKSKSQAQSPKRQQTLISGMKTVVFPSILQRTKQDIKKLREHMKQQINGETDQSFNKEQNESKPVQKMKTKPNHRKVLSQANSNPNLRSIFTELSLIAPNSLASSIDLTNKFRRLSPLHNEHLWSLNNKVNRINKVFELQKEIHHLERFKNLWKPDMIQQYMQLKLVLKGLNFKKGLRQIYLLIHLPHQNIILKSSQTEAKHLPTSIELSAFIYFIPIYEKINNNAELYDNMREWTDYFLDLLHYKQHSQTTKFFFLDGKELGNLSQIPSYEKFIYVNLHGKFDFWLEIQKNFKLPGSFLPQKYHKLATRMMDLKSKEDLLRYLSKRENLLPFFYTQPEKKNKIEILTNSHHSNQIEIQDDYLQTNTEMFDKSIMSMTEKEQSSYLKTIQHYINQNKTKYSNKLVNLEENMRFRQKNIKANRRKSIELKLKSKKNINLEEEKHFERRLLYEDEMSIDEIKDDAMDHATLMKTVIFKKTDPSNKIEIEDPFESFNQKDNQRFKDIFKLVNVEKIVLEKKISRQDVLHYLSLFKALMDSDTVVKQKEFKYPALFITLDHLRRGLAYIALHRNKINTKKLNEVYRRSYNYVDFMEFLDIFTTEFSVTDSEIMENADDSKIGY